MEEEDEDSDGDEDDDHNETVNGQFLITKHRIASSRLYKLVSDRYANFWNYRCQISKK